MGNDERINLLAKIARSTRATQAGVIIEPGARSDGPSILSLAAATWGARPGDEATVPTGFDPRAAVLFEAIVEGAYLVATADGIFDDEEQRTFERIVTAACDGMVAPKHVAGLVSDLAEQLAEDGLERRVAAIASRLERPEHAEEVLRIATLIAHVSDDVSAVERHLLEQLATACKLDRSVIDAALADVKRVLAQPSK